MTLSEELQWRGFVKQTTLSDITALDNQTFTFYWGVDPSAPSMTIGNLAAAMMVRHFIEHGHKAVLLVGGATGMIGDPDGKAEERNLKTMDEVAANKAGIAAQYQTVFGGQSFELVDNYDWFKDMNYLTFLRDTGKHVPMRQMLAREFVQTRLGEEGAGISYAEFSYVLIQAYDFLHLHRELGVNMQVCGSDQWGNSIAGVDLIRRVTGDETHVWSVPLVINKATGKKFGKSEDGAIWLDPKLTSPYKFYQFWLNVDDEGVADYIKIYTLLSKEDIERILSEFEADRAGRAAQKALAYEVTKLVHGQQMADDMVRISVLVVSKDPITDADYPVIAQALGAQSVHPDQGLASALVDLGLAGSLTEANRFLKDGAISINNVKVEDPNKVALSADDFRQGIVVLRRGKNNVAVGVAS